MPEPVIGNKAELASRLSISLPTLSSWLLKYPDFPIASRGSNGRSYAFDFAQVFDFLRARQEEQDRSKAEKDEALAQLRLPFDLPGMDLPAGPKASAKDELDAWRLRKMQREEMEASGQLVPATEMLAKIEAVLSRINRDAYGFIRQLGKEQSWSDAYIRSLEARFGDLQRAAVKELTIELAAPDPGVARAYG